MEELNVKRILTTMCALAVLAASAVPTWAAEAPESHYYPVEVKEYLEGDSPRISKIYQLSLSDDPSAIPTGDFERDGRLYFLLDMTRKDEIGVDTKLHTQTVTAPSSTDNMENILQTLAATLETVTEDGYTGVLRLDHTTVKVTTDGYANKSQPLSATRTYPNLSDADASLIPKTIEEKGKTLTLSNVEWTSAYQTEGSGAVLRYSATASYSGSNSYRVATGYTVTADYTGEVAKTGCDVVTYTAMFGSVEKPGATPAPDAGDESGSSTPPSNTANSEKQPDSDATKPAHPLPWVRILVIGGVVVVLAAGGVFAAKKIKERK